jgi:hypothetical protein
MIDIDQIFFFFFFALSADSTSIAKYIYEPQNTAAIQPQCQFLRQQSMLRSRRACMKWDPIKQTRDNKKKKTILLAFFFFFFLWGSMHVCIGGAAGADGVQRSRPAFYLFII